MAVERTLSMGFLTMLLSFDNETLTIDVHQLINPYWGEKHIKI